MDNDTKMFGQVAAEAGVSEQQASIACYLLGLSHAGKGLDDAATLLRMERADVRDHARSWSIPFADYVPQTEPLRLTWTKAKRGLWELRDSESVVAIAQSDGEGGYSAGIGGRPRESWDGSKAHIAIKRVSHVVERCSVAMFGSDDVIIIGPDEAGIETRLAPRDIGDRKKLAAALHH